MQLFYGFQNLVLSGLGIAALACELFAFIDALRHRDAVYLAAGKRTRGFWLIVTGIALAFGIVTVGNPLQIVGLLGFVGAAIYLADVRPALRQVRGQGPRSSGGW